jgi:hypothetical protein
VARRMARKRSYVVIVKAIGEEVTNKGTESLLVCQALQQGSALAVEGRRM